MKNIILFILLIILVIIYYKNYFSIKEDFQSIGLVSEMMKQGQTSLDVPMATITVLNNVLQSIIGKKNDKEIEAFTGNSHISCNDYTTLLNGSEDYNTYKDLWNSDEEKDKKKYLTLMIEESILLGCSGECTIDIEKNACKKIEKFDENKIKDRIIEYKKKIRDLWNGAEDEKVEEGSRWEDWNKYLYKNNNYETVGVMPYKGLKPKIETSWFDW